MICLATVIASCASPASNPVTPPAPAPTPTATPTQKPSQETAYVESVKAFTEKFYNHRKEYNDGLERIGAQVRSATTETEQRQALQQAVTHLDNSRQLFHQDMDDFAKVLPPLKFQDYYLLMNDVLRDYVDVTTSFITYYSMNLNQGTQDLQLANRASTLLRTANENLQRAGLMIIELTRD